MSNVVVTRRNIFSRLGDSVKGMVGGVVIFLAAFPLLFWNEGRAVKTYKTLQAGSGAVQSYADLGYNPGSPERSMDGQLVHVTANVTVEGTLSDGAFGVQVEGAAGLRRKVEMFQWVERSSTERRERIGGTEETITTYTYAQEWNRSAINSSGFNTPQSPPNPPMPYEDQTFQPESARFGGFIINSGQLGRMSTWQDYPLSNENLPTVPQGFRIEGGTLYRGVNPAAPQIGDVRVSFERADATQGTIIGQQTPQNTFTNFETSAGTLNVMVSRGSATAEEMFEAAHKANVMWTWILRLLGWAMMFGGLKTFFKPLSVIVSVLPIAGAIVRTGVSIVAFLVATPLALIVIAIAWIFYRPLLGILLLVLGGGAIFGLKTLWKKGPPPGEEIAEEPPVEPAEA